MSKAIAPLSAALGLALLFFVGTAANGQPRTTQIIPAGPQSQERISLRVNYRLSDPCVAASVSLGEGTIKVLLRCVQVIGRHPVGDAWIVQSNYDLKLAARESGERIKREVAPRAA